jgi:hypothetical protein
VYTDITPQIGGGLALGATLLGAGLFAYKHHEKSEEEVGLTSKVLAFDVKAHGYCNRKRPKHGVFKAGSRTHRCALKSSTGAVPVVLPPGSLCMARISLTTATLAVRRMAGHFSSAGPSTRFAFLLHS